MNKEIEKIARDLAKIKFCPDKIDESFSERCNEKACTFCLAESLYNAGYRKAGKVKKKVLQNLVKVIKESGRLFDYSEFVGEGPFWAIDLDDLEEIISQEFGVEVEE